MKHAVIGLCSLALSAPFLVQGAAPTAADLDFFEKEVRPILINRCYECHSTETGKSKGGLMMDTRAALLTGGDTGPALIAGQVENSLIVHAVRYQKQDLQMPPKGALPQKEVRVLEEWIRRGAPDPRTQAPAVAASGARKIDIEQGRQHWSFRPVQKVSPPVDVAPHPVDAFILTALRKKGLELAPQADPYTLIRRATFDLTGLPPTPEEITTYLAAHERDPQAAFRALVDRLLASPHYGEKWGRHWLDIARYADSNGLDENIALGTAWRYRDYVVSAFNEDLPFDQFLIQQIAGDLLPADNLPQRQRNTTATGFLNLGAKVLAEPDKEKLLMDIIDEQIDTTGRAFMGMTLGCVRCHDHKFDPVLQSDYYALAAIFKSTHALSRDRLGALSLALETPLGGLDDFAQVYSAERALAVAKKELSAGQTAAKKTPGPESQARVDELMTRVEEVEKTLPDYPTALSVQDASTIHASLPIHIRGSHLTLGKAVARGYPQVMQPVTASAPQFPEKASGRLELARWLASPQHPLTSRVLVNRVWTWHFGQGIVHTPDNFGLLGEAPTHPELLDWLANWISTHHWSVKDLHRLLMTSRTYQQASRPAEKAGTDLIDPENRLLHHFPIRRLQAEEIRDAIHGVAGTLDRHIGGKTVPLRNRQFVFNHTSKDATRYDSPRRALYLPIIRNNLYDLFQQFDYPDPTVPTGRRDSTVVAPQALLLMNSPLTQQAAAHLAPRIRAAGSDLSSRLRFAHLLIHGRPPQAADEDQARAFLEQAERALLETVPETDYREQQVWELFCHTLLLGNEFLHLR